MAATATAPRKGPFQEGKKPGFQQIVFGSFIPRDRNGKPIKGRPAPAAALDKVDFLVLGIVGELQRELQNRGKEGWVEGYAQQDIADWANQSRVHVSNSINRLKARRMILKNDSGGYMVDWSTAPQLPIQERRILKKPAGKAEPAPNPEPIPADLELECPECGSGFEWTGEVFARADGSVTNKLGGSSSAERNGRNSSQASPAVPPIQDQKNQRVTGDSVNSTLQRPTNGDVNSTLQGSPDERGEQKAKHEARHPERIPEIREWMTNNFLRQVGRKPTGSEVETLNYKLGDGTLEQLTVRLGLKRRKLTSYAFLYPFALECADSADVWNETVDKARGLSQAAKREPSREERVAWARSLLGFLHDPEWRGSINQAQWKAELAEIRRNYPDVVAEAERETVEVQR